MNKKTVCYLRVSSFRQDTDLQKRAIDKHLAEQKITGVEWLEDKVSGKTARRKEFQKLINSINAGRVEMLIAYDTSRLGRSMQDNWLLAQACKERKTGLFLVHDNVDITTPEGQLIFTILSYNAQKESERISLRAKETAAIRKAKGLVHGGRAAGSTNRRIKEKLKALYALHDAGHSTRKICAELGINNRTVRKYLAKRGDKIETQKEVNMRVFGKSQATI